MSTNTKPTGTTQTTTLQATTQTTQTTPTATSATAITRATTVTTIGRTDVMRAVAATLGFLPPIIRKGERRTIRTRDREGAVQTVTTVDGLQATIRSNSGEIMGRSLGTNEHQTVVDARFESMGTAVRNGHRIQLWLNDAVDVGYSEKVGPFVNHYSILHEFIGYSTCEANDNAIAPRAEAA